LHIAVIGPDDASRRCLLAAADPFPDDPKLSCDALEQAPADMDWDKYAMVVWDAPLPTGTVAARLEEFARAGGVLMFFPSAGADANAFASASFGEPVTADAGRPYRIIHWDGQDGPLADSESGTPLAVSNLGILKARPIASGGDVRALFGDNHPFLTEKLLGKGHVYFCATLPQADWSTLEDGRVLVPMLQRILQQGAKRFAAGSFLDAGDAFLIENPEGWTCLDSPDQAKDVRSQAGVYRNGARLIAVNRPASENDPDRVSPGVARGLFPPLSAYLFEVRGPGLASLQGEIWRALLFAMLIFLVGESFLSLPPARTAKAGREAARTRQMAPPLAGARS
jgi:hypothetical protein